MYIQSQKEFKQVTSALRKELKALYPTSAPSHAQCLELLAKALGASGYAELLPKLPAERAVSKAPASSRFPLRNLHGLLDLVEPGDGEALVVDGLSFEETEGTIEDIRGCLAGVFGASRNSEGRLDPNYAGETDVNWDGQVTRLNSEGQALWQTQGGEVISEDRCILVPEGFDPEDEDTGFDLPNRELLLDAYLELAQEQGLTKSLHDQVVLQKLDSELLQGLAQTIGFSLHRGELTSLEGMLRARL